MISLDLDDYDQVEESQIRARAAVTKSKNLEQLLKVADQWREAELTPVFIIAQDEPMIIACVSLETFGKAFN